MRNWYNSQPLGDINQYYAGNGVTGFSPQSGMDFFSYNGQVQWERFGSFMDYHRIMHKASPVAAVFNKRANMFANGDIETLNRKSQKYVRGDNKEWERLIERPNPLQSKTAFFKQLHICLDLFGFCYVLKTKPVGFKSYSKLWILPPWLLSIELEQKDFWKIGDAEDVRKVSIEWQGKRTHLDNKDLILFTDDLSLIDEETLLPEGRLKELAYPITLTLSAYEALATLLQRKGALGILSTEKDPLGSMPIDPEEKRQIQDSFSQYGLTRGQWQVIITSQNLKWQPMSMNAKDLMILETLEAAKMDICDVYNFPFGLLSSAKGSTFSNTDAYKKMAYQDGTLPESKAIMEQLNRGLNTEEANIEYIINYDDVEVLQESRKIKAEADLAQLNAEGKAWELGLRTRNDMLLNTGKDTVEDEAFKQYKFTIDAENEERTAKLTQNAPTN